FAREAVIQGEKSFSVAGGSAHVGKDQRNAKFVQVIVEAAEEVGAELAFGAPVNVDHYGTLPSELGGRAIEKAADDTAIPRFPVDEFRLGEILGVQASGFALRPAVDFAGFHIERIDIQIGAGGRQIKAQVAVVLVPADVADDSLGQFGESFLLARGGVEKVQDSVAVFVGDEGYRLSVVGEVELVYVPGNVVREIAVLLAVEIDISKAVELRVLVRGRVDSFVVFAEFPSGVGNFRGCSFGCDEGLCSACSVEHPEIAFVGGDLLNDEDAAIIG